jgi:hypothetical protein
VYLSRILLPIVKIYDGKKMAGKQDKLTGCPAPSGTCFDSEGLSTKQVKQTV